MKYLLILSLLLMGCNRIKKPGDYIIQEHIFIKDSCKDLENKFDIKTELFFDSQIGEYRCGAFIKGVGNWEFSEKDLHAFDLYKGLLKDFKRKH